MKKPLPTFGICKHCGAFVRRDRRLHIQHELNIRIPIKAWMNNEGTVREHFREPTPAESLKYGIRQRRREQDTNPPEDDYDLVTRSNVFAPHSYSSEQELQDLVELNAEKVFGEKSIYVPLKMRIESPSGEKARVIDGLYLDFGNSNTPGFAVVEYELRKHSNDHIVPQVKDIYDWFTHRANRSDTARRVWEEVKGNGEKYSKARALLGTDEVHERIDEALKENFLVTIVLDRFDAEDAETPLAGVLDTYDLTTALDILDVDAWLIEFKTFEKDGELVHLCNGFLRMN